MRRICFSGILIALSISEVCGQFVPSSPCPKVFQYQNDGATVYGYIQLKPTGGPVRTLHVRANFTIAARLPTTYIGHIEAISNGPLQKFNHGFPVSYRVFFPVTSPVPRLTSITVNGETQCYGPADVPAPNQYVTTISLDHMLFPEEGPNPSYDNLQGPLPNLPPGLIVNYVGSLEDRTQMNTMKPYRFHHIDNKGLWSSGYYPLDQYESYEPPIENNTVVIQQVFEQPVASPNQRPEVYLTEQIAETTKTPPPPPSPTVVSSKPRQMSESPKQFECGVIAGGNERIPLIHQGKSYSRGDLPWLVALYKRQEGSLSFICAGTLVSNRHIVTAAHCMHHKGKISNYNEMVVKIGVYNLEDWGDDISVTRTLQAAHIHESYNATTLENDILLLTLHRTVEFNTFIRPACLWSGNIDLSHIVGATGVVAGWGASELGPTGQGEPRMVRIPVVSTSQCRASKPEFHKLTSSKTLCAGDRSGSGPCLGDSGGGLYILDSGRWRLRGVVSLSLRPSNGANYCDLNEYIVFTDTAQYLSWIRKILYQNYFDK